MLNTNQPQVPEYSSTQQNQSANISLTPPPSPFPAFPDDVHVHLAPSSPQYHYITEEASFSPDPYGIGLDSGNMLLSPILDISSSNLPLLTLPTHLRNKTRQHQPSSGGGATVITALSPTPAVNVDTVTVPSQPSAAAPPSFTSGENTSGAASSNGTVAAAVEVHDMPMNTFEHGLGSNQNTLEAATIMVKCNEDIIKRLISFAKDKEIFILAATGIVSYAELLNQQDAPVAKTTLQGRFEIISLDGNIVLPKNSKKNQANRLTVLVAGDDTRVRGGPVRRLIAGSNVQIVVGTMSPSAIESLARQQYLGRPELLHFPNYRNRDWLTTEVVNQIHKATLKELNETNTP